MTWKFPPLAWEPSSKAYTKVNLKYQNAQKKYDEAIAFILTSINVYLLKFAEVISPNPDTAGQEFFTPFK